MRYQFAQASLARDGRKVPHESRTNTLALIFVGYRESYLSLTSFNNDITCPAGNDRTAPFVHHSDQGNVSPEVGI